MGTLADRFVNIPEISPLVTSVFCEKKDKTLYFKYYISRLEQHELTGLIGDAAVLLYMYYLRMASVEHPVISDESTAWSLGWTARKVRRYRTALSKHGWYRQVSYTRTDGIRGIEYHIGKVAVASSHHRSRPCTV